MRQFIRHLSETSYAAPSNRGRQLTAAAVILLALQNVRERGVKKDRFHTKQPQPQKKSNACENQHKKNFKSSPQSPHQATYENIDAARIPQWVSTLLITSPISIDFWMRDGRQE